MRFAVVHSTEYRYSSPVHLEPHAIRLRPREDATERLLEYSLEIDPPPALRAAALDQDGNSVTNAWFEGLVERLSLRVSFLVETLRENPFEFLLQSGDTDIPIQYAEPLRIPLAAYLGMDHNGEVREFAHELARESSWRTMEFLAALNRRLFETTTQLIRREGPPQPPERTLASRQGSCRDTAVLFCAACRTVGIAARFVSGYERAAALGPDGGEMHAWAEVYLQGGGWRGYDPSRGLAVTQFHIPVAAAADPVFAAPITGTFRGAAEAAMQYEIRMEVS